MNQAEHIEKYTLVTNDIEVTVSPYFLAGDSDPSRRIFAYAYTVFVRNISQETVQLINRHWIVISGGQQIADVKGEGVVGEQPIIRPGDSFQYTSGTVVVDPIGSMHGTYTFRSESGKFFDVQIPRFNLFYIESEAIH